MGFFLDRLSGFREDDENIKQKYRQKDGRRKKVIKIPHELSAKGKYKSMQYIYEFTIIFPIIYYSYLDKILTDILQFTH